MWGSEESAIVWDRRWTLLKLSKVDGHCVGCRTGFYCACLECLQLMLTAAVVLLTAFTHLRFRSTDSVNGLDDHSVKKDGAQGTFCSILSRFMAVVLILNNIRFKYRALLRWTCSMVVYFHGKWGVSSYMHYFLFHHSSSLNSSFTLLY